MGKQFGQLAKMRGIVQFRISHYEQNPLAGIFSKGFPNMIRRIRSNIFPIAPLFLFGYLVYDWTEKEHARRQRKNPADYANDE